MAGLFSLTAKAQQYEPNENVKRVVEIAKQNPTSSNTKKFVYEKMKIVGDEEWRAIYMDNGVIGVIGQEDKFYLIIRKNGKTEYYFMDYNLDGISAHDLRRGNDSFRVPNDDYNNYKGGIVFVDKSDDTLSDFMNDCYYKKIAEAISHFSEG